MAATMEGEVEARARQVFKASWDYHFSYEVFASLEIFRQEYKKSQQEKRSQLKASRATASAEEAAALDQEIDRITRPLSIRVEYDDDKKAQEQDGWVVYNEDYHQFIIQLPDSLKTPWNENGTTTDPVKEDKLRRTTAHEIGHVALHAVEILEKGSSKKLKKEQEDEADLFAKVLMELRSERNDLLQQKKDGEPQTKAQ